MNRDTKPPVEKAEQSIVASRWLGQSDADPSTSFLTSPTPMAGPMPDSSAPSSSVPSSSMPSSSVPGNSVPSSPSMPSSSMPNSLAADSPASPAPNKINPDTKVSAVPSTQALSPPAAVAPGCRQPVRCAGSVIGHANPFRADAAGRDDGSAGAGGRHGTCNLQIRWPPTPWKAQGPWTSRSDLEIGSYQSQGIPDLSGRRRSAAATRFPSRP